MGCNIALHVTTRLGRGLAFSHRNLLGRLEGASLHPGPARIAASMPPWAPLPTAVLELPPHPVRSEPACHLPVELEGLCALQREPASGRRLEE